MVVTKAQNLQNWTTYMVAVFMTKDYKVCCEIWDSIMQILGDDPLSQLKLHELNELFLFRVKIFEAMGEYKKGIKFVLKYRNFIVDDPRRNECLADMYMKNN
jgi:hypothetical protein